MEIGRRKINPKKEINNKKVKRPIKYNNLKLNVDVNEQQDDIKHLKEHLKEMAWCVTCNPSIATTKNWLKTGIQETKKSSGEIILAKC